jgi:hypothetical protein
MIASKEDLEQYNALVDLIHEAFTGKEVRVDILLDVLASHVAAAITCHPSTRERLEKEFMQALRDELLAYDKGEREGRRTQ